MPLFSGWRYAKNIPRKAVLNHKAMKVGIHWINISENKIHRAISPI